MKPTYTIPTKPGKYWAAVNGKGELLTNLVHYKPVTPGCTEQQFMDINIDTSVVMYLFRSKKHAKIVCSRKMSEMRRLAMGSGVPYSSVEHDYYPVMIDVKLEDKKTKGEVHGS